MTIYGAIPRGAYKQQPKLMPRSLGFERYALGFNGLDNSIEVPDSASIRNLYRSPFTIEVFAKKTVLLPGGETLVGWGWGVRINLDGALFQWRGLLAGVWTTFASITGGWIQDLGQHHWVLKWDGLAYTFCRDGNALPTTSIGNVSDASVASLLIGAFTVPGTQVFNGLISLVRIYKDYALSLEEVRWNRLNYHNPVRPDKLALWLPMEEGSGLVAADHSGLGNNGALLPALTPPTWEQVRQYELRAETEQ